MTKQSGRLLASSPTLEGIQEQIRRYYFMESTRGVYLHEAGDNRWDVTRDTERADKTLPVYVVKKGRRYQLREKD